MINTRYIKAKMFQQFNAIQFMIEREHVVRTFVSPGEMCL